MSSYGETGNNRDTKEKRNMPNPIISNQQQNVLAEVVFVVRSILGANPNSPLLGMDALRTLMLANEINLVDLENYLRTTGHNEVPTTTDRRLAEIMNGDMVPLTPLELGAILAKPKQELPPCLNYCKSLDAPGSFIAWMGSHPTGKIELSGRILATT